MPPGSAPLNAPRQPPMLVSMCLPAPNPTRPPAPPATAEMAALSPTAFQSYPSMWPLAFW
ncbi:Uncharacterised protein [Mycobacteroides abscessus subsp. abscessus]|nr:Uncharacterised protein [Mycobacteroides abscessus subsp. abscessus]